MHAFPRHHQPVSLMIARLFACSFKPGTLRMSDHTNAEHFFGFCLQVFCHAEPPKRVACLATIGNKRKESFPWTQP